MLAAMFRLIPQRRFYISSKVNVEDIDPLSFKKSFVSFSTLAKRNQHQPWTKWQQEFWPLPRQISSGRLEILV
jgi:hypothetical protein